MLYLMTMQFQDGLTRDERDGALVRRAQWEPPSDANVIGEYWTASEDPAVVVVFEADSMGPIFEIGVTWGDVFKINVSPAMTAEDGLKIGPEILGRRAV
jgi:Domain of unknown function (DUF3303)